MGDAIGGRRRRCSRPRCRAAFKALIIPVILQVVAIGAFCASFVELGVRMRGEEKKG